MNAIALLKADHRIVRELFEKLEHLEGKGSDKTKKTLVEKLVRELSVHAAIEEEFFYPEVKASVADTAALVFKSLEEHSVAKWELASIESMDADDERYDAKLQVLKDAVLRHIDEEENELFPRVRDALDNAKLNALGAALTRAKKTAPTRPHPRAPDEPPANIVANLGASVIDRARDAGRDMLRRRGGGKRAAPAVGRHAKSTRATTRRTKPATRARPSR